MEKSKKKKTNRKMKEQQKEWKKEIEKEIKKQKEEKVPNYQSDILIQHFVHKSYMFIPVLNATKTE